PRWLERFLSWFVMTSEKHYIHHSMRIEQTNSNYASTFAWDRLFGTFRQDDPDTLEAGLEEYRDPKKLGFWNLMLMPFRSTKRP
ncbi:MAG: sterol desaturase family protein, partial [Elusimicrobiota bacterium]